MYWSVIYSYVLVSVHPCTFLVLGILKDARFLNASNVQTLWKRLKKPYFWWPLMGTRCEPRQKNFYLKGRKFREYKFSRKQNFARINFRDLTFHSELLSRKLYWLIWSIGWLSVRQIIAKWPLMDSLVVEKSTYKGSVRIFILLPYGPCEARPRLVWAIHNMDHAWVARNIWLFFPYI